MEQIVKLNRDKGDWKHMTGIVLMTWSIFNPNGPTLNSLGLADTPDPDIKEMFYRWLHFLHDETYRLGFIDVSEEGGRDELAAIVNRGFAPTLEDREHGFQMFTCIPHLVTHAFKDEASDLPIQFLRLSSPFREADWGREMYYLDKYGGQLFDRAGEELREAVDRMRKEQEEGIADHGDYLQFLELRYANVPAFAESGPVQYASKPYDLLTLQRWWETINDEAYRVLGLTLFAEAWVGASCHQAQSLPVVVSFEDVREFLARYRHPVWPDSYTTESLAQSVGLGTRCVTH